MVLPSFAACLSAGFAAGEPTWEGYGPLRSPSVRDLGAWQGQNNAGGRPVNAPSGQATLGLII
jgi:hypothetical protein